MGSLSHPISITLSVPPLKTVIQSSPRRHSCEWCVYTQCRCLDASQHPLTQEALLRLFEAEVQHGLWRTREHCLPNILFQIQKTMPRLFSTSSRRKRSLRFSIHQDPELVEVSKTIRGTLEHVTFPFSVSETPMHIHQMRYPHPLSRCPLSTAFRTLQCVLANKRPCRSLACQPQDHFCNFRWWILWRVHWGRCHLPPFGSGSADPPLDLFTCQPYKPTPPRTRLSSAESGGSVCLSVCLS